MRKSSDEQKQVKSSQIRVLTASKAKELLGEAYKSAEIQLNKENKNFYTKEFSTKNFGKKKLLKKLDNLIENFGEASDRDFRKKSDDAMWQLMKFISSYKKDFSKKKDETVDTIVNNFYDELDKNYIPFSLYDTLNQFGCLEHCNLRQLLDGNYQQELSEILSIFKKHSNLNLIVNKDVITNILTSNIAKDKLTCKYTAAIIKKISEKGYISQKILDIVITAGKSEGTHLLSHWLQAIYDLESTGNFNPTNLNKLLEQKSAELITQFVDKLPLKPLNLENLYKREERITKIEREKERTEKKEEKLTEKELQSKVDDSVAKPLKEGTDLKAYAKELENLRKLDSLPEVKKEQRQDRNKKEFKETGSFDNKSDYNAICAFFRKPKTKLPSFPTPVKNPTREFGFR